MNNHTDAMNNHTKTQVRSHGSRLMYLPGFTTTASIAELNVRYSQS